MRSMRSSVSLGGFSGLLRLSRGSARISVPESGRTGPWFKCVRCNRRVGKLYYSGASLACRQCLEIRYASQHRGTRSRSYLQALKLRLRLNGIAFRAHLLRRRRRLTPTRRQKTSPAPSAFVDLLCRCCSVNINPIFFKSGLVGSATKPATASEPAHMPATTESTHVPATTKTAPVTSATACGFPNPCLEESPMTTSYGRGP